MKHGLLQLKKWKEVFSKGLAFALALSLMSPTVAMAAEAAENLENGIPGYEQTETGPAGTASPSDALYPAATASDSEYPSSDEDSPAATASDALYDEDGFLLDGEVRDDVTPETEILEDEILQDNIITVNAPKMMSGYVVVTMYANGGYFDDNYDDPAVFEFDSSCTFSDSGIPAVSSDEYYFLGWSTTKYSVPAPQNAKPIDLENTYPENGMKLYAVWAADSAPIIIEQPYSQEVPLGEYACFYVNAEGYDLHYQWYYSKDGQNWYKTTVEGAKTPMIEFEATEARNGNWYRCEVTGGGVTETSDAALLTIEETTMIVEQPYSQEVPAGEYAYFWVGAEGYDLHYQWYYSKDCQNWYRTTVEGAKTNQIRVEATAARNGNWYRCEVTGGGVTETSAPAQLTIEGTTRIVDQPESQVVPAGEYAYFWVGAEGDDLHYQWYYSKDGRNWYKTTVEGADTDLIWVEATAARNGNWYRCEVTGSGGKATSAPARLTVDTATRIIEQPESRTVGVGSLVYFYVYASGVDLRYQWYYSKDCQNWYKTTVDGAKTNEILVEATAARNGNWYRCEVTGAEGPVTSDPAMLTVKTVVITEQSGSKTVPAGQTADFYVYAEGADLSYQWYYSKDCQNWYKTTVEGAKTNEIRVEATAARNGNWYRCEVTGGGETVTSDPMMLMLKVSDVLRIYSHPGSQEVPAGYYASFSVIASGADLGYQWYYSKDCQNWYKTTVEGAKTNEITVEATAARNGNWYRCEVTGGGETVTSDPARLTVNDTFRIYSQSSSQAMTVGSDVVFYVMAVGTDLSYQWYYSKDGQNWSRTTVEGAKTDEIRFKATAARNGNWYRCEVTGSGETLTSAPARLTVYEKGETIIYDQSRSGTYSPGQTAYFSVSAAGTDLRYQWYYSKDGRNWYKTTVEGAKTNAIRFEATAARNGNWYRCEVTGAGGSVTSDPVMLTVDGTTRIIYQSDSKEVPAGEYAYFYVYAGGEDLSYQWYYSKDGRNWYKTTVEGAKTSEIMFEATAARNGNWYRCEVTGAGGTVTSDPARLTVDETTRILDQSNSKTVPAGEYAYFHVEAGGVDLSYQWYYSKDGRNWYKTTVEGAKTSEIEVEATAARNGNWYRCEVTGARGKVTSFPVRLTVESVMVTGQSASRAVPAGEYVSFYVSATGEDLSYQWYYSKDGRNWYKTTVEGAKTEEITVEATAARNGNWYRCEVTGGGGKAVSDPVKLIVLQQ